MSVTHAPAVTSFGVRTPANWHYLDFQADTTAQVADFVERATAHVDRDSSATRRHRMREAITALVGETETRSGVVAVHGVLVPVPSGDAASLVPAAITCATVEVPSAGLRPLEVLVAAARTDPTARPVEAGDGVALRTHRFRDVRERLVERAHQSGVSARQRSRILAETPDEMFGFRVDYLTGRQQPDMWVKMSLSALVPVDDVGHELARAYLELGDAVAGTFAWATPS